MQSKSISARKGARRGAKPFVPTKEQREGVRTAAMSGFTEARIARHLGICTNSLRKHFCEELQGGRAKRSLDILVALYNAGIRGNVRAQKAYLAGGDRAERLQKARESNEE